jgi:hypothetical protein
MLAGLATGLILVLFVCITLASIGRREQVSPPSLLPQHAIPTQHAQKSAVNAHYSSHSPVPAQPAGRPAIPTMVLPASRQLSIPPTPLLFEPPRFQTTRVLSVTAQQNHLREILPAERQSQLDVLRASQEAETAYPPKPIHQEETRPATHANAARVAEVLTKAQTMAAKSMPEQNYVQGEATPRQIPEAVPDQELHTTAVIVQETNATPPKGRKRRRQREVSAGPSQVR